MLSITNPPKPMQENDSPAEPNFAYFLDIEPTNIFAAWRGSIGDSPYPNRRCDSMVEGLGAVYNRPNSGVAWTKARLSLLGPRVSEEVARRLHPRLFERIDREI